MSGDDLQFEEFIELCDEQYEYGLIEFKNGDIVNKPGENDGSAKVLSYAALADMDKDTTLKVCLWKRDTTLCKSSFSFLVNTHSPLTLIIMFTNVTLLII